MQMGLNEWISQETGSPQNKQSKQCTDEWAVDDSREAERVAAFYYNIQIRMSLIVWESSNWK